LSHPETLPLVGQTRGICIWSWTLQNLWHIRLARLHSGLPTNIASLN